MARTPFPFSAIVGQDQMKLGLMIVAVDPTVGGVLVFGDRGTGKSTAVRGLAGLLPKMKVVTGCAYGCAATGDVCIEGCSLKRTKKVATHEAPVPVVDLPLGATEDRVVGSIDIERALSTGEKVFEPGLLARAHRGFLYIDEANLLEDHVVDLLLDVAASGENVVEREGLSIRHPARFVLIGSGNPEEGELRPQLLDRFGLSVDVKTPQEIPLRVEIVRRRDAFERDRDGFVETWRAADKAVARTVAAARRRLDAVVVADSAIERAATLCLALGTDGLRGELTLIRAARALAAIEGMAEVGDEALKRVAPMALRHRLRRDPLDETGSTARIDRALEEVFVA